LVVTLDVATFAVLSLSQRFQRINELSIEAQNYEESHSGINSLNGNPICEPNELAISKFLVEILWRMLMHHCRPDASEVVEIDFKVH
jgi:hypothetical protein